MRRRLRYQPAQTLRAASLPDFVGALTRLLWIEKLAEQPSHCRTMFVGESGLLSCPVLSSPVLSRDLASPAIADSLCLCWLSLPEQHAVSNVHTTDAGKLC